MLLEQIDETSHLHQVSIEHIPFYPLPGLRSPHVQTILPALFW